MALDANLQIVDSEVVDISEGTSQSSTAFNIGRSMLVQGVWFVVDIEEVTADATGKPYTFYLEMTTDNGSNWFRAAAITTNADVARRWSVPVGPIDTVPEQHASGDIDVRVTVTYDDGSGTDNFTYSAYLAGPHHEANAPYA